MNKWDNVTKEHVIRAINEYNNGNKEKNPAKNTFLLYKKRRYPAKHIRGLAYFFANNEKISPSKYSGGEETQRFFEKLGFKVEYKKIVRTDMLKIFDWRSFELQIQRARLVYIKSLFYFTPPKKEIYPNSGFKENFVVFNSANGKSFTISPVGFGCIYIGSGKGSVSFPELWKSNNDTCIEALEIKKDLNERVQQLRNILKNLMNSGNIGVVLSMLQNYFWIKYGMHEFVFDIVYTNEDNLKYNKEDANIREHFLYSIRNFSDLGKYPNIIKNIEDLYHFIQHKTSWNKYAICSFDTGPIAWRKKPTFMFSDIIRSTKKFFTDHPNIRKFIKKEQDRIGAIFDNGDVNNDYCYNVKKHENQCREYVVNALSDIYEFGLLYHRDNWPETIGYFRKKQEFIKRKIRSVENKINKIIDRESLPLKKYSFKI